MSQSARKLLILTAVLIVASVMVFKAEMFTKSKTRFASAEENALPVEKSAPLQKTEPKIPPAVETPKPCTENPQETALVPELKVIEGRIHKKPLYTELVSCGLPPAQVLALSSAFKNIFDFRDAQPDDQYRLFFTKENQLCRFVYQAGKTNAFEAEINKECDSGFDVFRHEISLEKQTSTKTFTIESSLYNAILNGGEKQQLVSKFVDIFAWDIDFYLYPRKGDRIMVLYEKYSKDGDLIRYGNILAAVYEGKKHKFSAFRFEENGIGNYYDETGRPLKKMFLRIPVKFGTLTSSYSIRRFHPVSKKYKRHTGIDYGAPQGTPIFATASGRVVFAGWKTGYGNLIILKHPNGYQTYYGHCSKLIARKNELVEQGQIIARVGQTGVATGPHVHYEVRINQKPINPNTVKKTSGPPVKPELLPVYRQMIRERMLLVEKQLKKEAETTLALP
ncbi:MAG: M23 family metallopeptidase [Deltaproteobacteria bacterium]|nr:M23 family metallopeptidase [Deltaproteobacteria bacterium]